MPILPLLKHLDVSHFGMFPGSEVTPGIHCVVDSGVTLIAGINGLGKTTLLNTILRLLTGPNDLTGAGLPTVGSTLPETAPSLNREALRFFAQRVADDARGATASLVAQFGTDELIITRRLDNLALVSVVINGNALVRIDEDHYQAAMCKLMELSSFVDVLLVLHHTVFFPEGRPGALWDRNAQRQLLRAILLPPTIAAQISDLERKVGSADSAARNVSAVLYPQRRLLEEARALQAAAPGVRAEVKSKQALLSAAEGRRDALDKRRQAVDLEKRGVQLDLERAKIEREEAARAVERVKYESLSRVFPKLKDAALLTVLTLLASAECLVCGAHAEVARKAAEAELSRGDCPICHSPPSEQANVVAAHEVEASRLERLQKRAQQAIQEEQSLTARFVALEREYDAILGSLKEHTTEIATLQGELQRLDAKLPKPSQQVVELQQQVDALEATWTNHKARRAEFSAALREVHKLVQSAAVEKTEMLVESFGRYALALLSEEAVLVRDTMDAGIAQAEEEFKVPSFFADMSSAARPGLSRRRTASDVSESQRELIDLAFRFSLLEAAGAKGGSTLIMETPEASLDELAMERVGKALYDFASTGENRLVATSNLTNAGMIAWLFGGPVKAKRDLAKREERTINLLELSAKNRALRDDQDGRYPALLKSALSGRS